MFSTRLKKTTDQQQKHYKMVIFHNQEGYFY